MKERIQATEIEAARRRPCCAEVEDLRMVLSMLVAAAGAVPAGLLVGRKHDPAP